MALLATTETLLVFIEIFIEFHFLWISSGVSLLRLALLILLDKRSTL